MSKKLRRNPLYVAPGIIGWINENYNTVIFDEENFDFLDPNNLEDKIRIYERQVKGWFLKPASKFLKTDENGFIILMICLSYLEGIQQYVEGRSSHRRSRECFVSSIQRIYPDKYNDIQVNELYSEARCGLFHNGMTEGKIIISFEFLESIFFADSYTIQINPRLLLLDINDDFKDYLSRLNKITESNLRDSFNNMFSVLW